MKLSANSIRSRLVPLLVLAAAAAAGAQSGNISSTDKYAWSENGGWLNFRPTGGGVTVFVDHLEGYAWAENVGWIKLGSHTGGGTHTYLNTTSANWGVNHNSSTGALSGYAWSENAGWVNFAPTGGGVTVDSGTGQFDGYAWGENVGWVHFHSTSPTAYGVVSNSPLLAELDQFRARNGAEAICVEWATRAELDTAGFRLWRAQRADGDYELLTLALIPAAGDGASGAAYRYDDDATLPRQVYWYRLEVVGVDGETDFYGPVSARRLPSLAGGEEGAEERQ